MIELPINKIKIDGGVLESINSGQSTKVLSFLRGFKAMADHLGIEIAVAGVESEQQREFCQNLGVHHMQGYLLARPDSAEAFARRLQGRGSGPRTTGDETLAQSGD
jgi:EAL domain-containing protein (putative c-di-GMP-specific phosphodiesterase class I)